MNQVTKRILLLSEKIRDSIMTGIKGTIWCILILGLAITFNSCKAIKTVKQMNASEVETYSYSNTNKQYIFIPMIHVAKPEYYESVKQSITKAKNNGYVLYYEWIDFDVAPEEIKYKIREMVGLLPSTEGYKNALKPLVEKGYVIQTNDKFLSIVNNKDFKVDITAEEVVQKFEDTYGVIEITDENRATPWDEKYKATKSMKDVKKIILEYRNKVVAEKIAESDDSQIVIIYGGEHREGIFQELKQRDNNWQEIEE